MLRLWLARGTALVRNYAANR